MEIFIIIFMFGFLIGGILGFGLINLLLIKKLEKRTKRYEKSKKSRNTRL